MESWPSHKVPFYCMPNIYTIQEVDSIWLQINEDWRCQRKKKTFFSINIRSSFSIKKFLVEISKSQGHISKVSTIKGGQWSDFDLIKPMLENVYYFKGLFIFQKDRSFQDCQLWTKPPFADFQACGEISANLAWGKMIGQSSCSSKTDFSKIFREHLFCSDIFGHLAK